MRSSTDATLTPPVRAGGATMETILDFGVSSVKRGRFSRGFERALTMPGRAM